MTLAVSPPTATYCVPFHAIAFRVLPDAGCSVQVLPSLLVRTAPSLPTATNRAPSQRTSCRTTVLTGVRRVQATPSALVKIPFCSPTATHCRPFEATPRSHRSKKGVRLVQAVASGLVNKGPQLPTASFFVPFAASPTSELRVSTVQ